MFAISLMKLILVARKAFAAYLIVSAVARPVLTSAGFYLLEKLSGPDLGRINPKVHDRIVTRKRSDLATVYPQYSDDEIDMRQSAPDQHVLRHDFGHAGR